MCVSIPSERLLFFYIFFIYFFNFIFKLYIIVLVLPNIKMNQGTDLLEPVHYSTSSNVMAEISILKH